VTLPGQSDKDLEESGFMDGSSHEGVVILLNINIITMVTDDAIIQSLQQRQMAAYQLCERMFDALMHWARTKDVRYLLAAQRSLTAVQNSDGDT